VIAGIFVGGRGVRMGGVDKGRLVHDGETLIERLVRACDGFDVVLVGRADACAELDLPRIADDPPGIGPIGGLAGLLDHAAQKGDSTVLALACDLPFVSAELVRRLAEHESDADAIAPQSDGVWQPLATRYQTHPALAATRVAIAAGEHSLQAVLRQLVVEAIAIDPRELRDWDTPEDQRQDTSTGEKPSG
jgi:molybdopterin-guanine dinucleotide biosynthesis protein A